MTEKLPNTEMVQPNRLNDRLDLLRKTKPKAWAVYEALLAAKKSEVDFDLSKPVLLDSLIELCKIFDVDPIFFACEDQFIIDNPDILKPEE